MLFSMLFLASCSPENEDKVSKPTTYAIEEVQPQIYVIEHDIDPLMEKTSIEKRNELNRIRALREDKDDLEEFEFKSRYSNVRRSIDGEVVFGYDKDIDNPDFK